MPINSDEHTDPWGRTVVDAERIFFLLYRGAKPEDIVCDTTEAIEQYNSLCRKFNKPKEVINSLAPPDIDPEQDHKNRIADWRIPDEYADLDVRKYVLSLCKSDDERARVNMEMDLFEERDFINILRLMIVLVDHFRSKSIVWGVGRGSSCASYVLFLLGVHKIDSLRYNLDISEFLK